MSPGNAASPVEITVLGARGRMGGMVLQACAERGPQVRVVAAVDAPGSPELGQPIGPPGLGLRLTDDLAQALAPGRVCIDFSAPAATLAALEACARAGAAMVIGTTGFDEAGKGRIRAAAARIPVVLAPNYSIGVNLLFKLTEAVAKVLADYDAEIIEAHHNQKKDAPSGTALGFGEAVARGRGACLGDTARYGREGLTGARPKGEIAFHAVRAGDIVGDHTVLFAGPGERVELRHVAHSRMTFAQGAVRAALFLAGRPAGLYGMGEVLGL